ncbi:MAG: hypothetical protein QGH59_01755, partial [Gemmatimonadota bacterium]|nr:hypothetical protein [Gemmatimonadota bacterium]
MAAGKLNPRQRIVLATIVRGHIESAQPVGSRWVARRCGLGLSPASIRNCMMDLEEMELLTHLHTSGGRLPTHAGYRVFVDELMGRGTLPGATRRRVEDSLREGRAGSLETLLDQACTLLGQISEQLSVVLSPRYDKSRVDRIELNQVDERRLLVVFRMASGLERTVVAGMPDDIGEDDMRQTLQIMNGVARGRTLADLVALRDDEEVRVMLRGLRVASSVYAGARELENDESNEHFHMWGASNMLSQPEFEDPSRLRGVFRALEQRQTLYGLFEPTRHRRSVSITI